MHLPNMATVLMVEKTIKDSDTPLRKTQLWKKLPKSVMYPTYERVLEYLESHNQIIIDEEGRVVWIAVDNPKLEKLLKTGVKLL